MSEEAQVESTEVVSDEQAVAQAVSEGQAESPEWLLPKYATEDRNQEEAISEQAKAYVELQKQFGSFTGAPEDYEISLSEELADKGIQIAEDDSMLEAFKERAKEMGINQEGFNGLVNLYAEQQLAEQMAMEDHKAEEMKQLGANADRRIQNINDWGRANLDEETFAGLEEAATSAAAVKAIEALISKTRNAPVAQKDAPAAPSVTMDDIRKEQFRTDEHGNRLMQTSKEHRAKVQRMYEQLVGTEENRVIVGG